MSFTKKILDRWGQNFFSKKANDEAFPKTCGIFLLKFVG